VYETAAGIGINTLRPSPASIYWNPAGMAFLRNGGILVEATPAFAYSPDISESVDEEIDKALEDFDQTPSTTIVYPDVTLEAGQEARAISSIAAAFPFKNMYFGLSYYKAFSLSVDAIIAQIENQITSVEDDSLDNATIFTRTDINMLLDLDAEAISIGAARKLNDKLGVGLTLSRNRAVTSINCLAAPEGVFTRRGIEKSFNDPSAGYQNNLYTSMAGDFTGGGWGGKLGVSYNPHKNVSLNFTGSFNGSLDLTGDMEIIQYFYTAVNLNADEDAGEETFDLSNIENFSQPTETVLADNVPDNHLKLNIPSSVSLGAAFRGLSLTVTGFSGELGYEYKLTRDGIPTNYVRGIKPKFGALLGLDMKAIQMSFGVISCDEVVEGYKNSDGDPLKATTGIIIPRFNMGTGFHVGENWKIDIMLLGVPDTFGSMLKVGATYSFK
jgi:hypothetical protein